MLALLLSAAAVFLHVRYGLLAGALLPCIAFVVVGVLAAKATTDARAALWRAVCLGITDPRQRPLQKADPLLMAPSAITLFKLASTLDAVRRGDTARAAEEVTGVNRSLLRAEEERLLNAARALIALDLGDRMLAAQLAAPVLPTGSGEFDARLGRVVVAEAWRSQSRLSAVDDAFRGRGLGVDLGTPLNRLAALVRVRVAPEAGDDLPASDVRALGDEARALGEDAFAAELETRTRATMYR
ncbi:Hypothetical protein CAP_2728 [Chondromyces apiculatus DSM 436]|uniref:Uncharacterized protein n=1 Tax=Chondromyces apiculatus DSM 436 TaxID=1192034 RepID=A0A017TIY9_9BACT|nr:Hypothetical protein CAP_2728 [Chondromyces apiculatus DSM 436]